jgi:hypothetical protein
MKSPTFIAACAAVSAALCATAASVLADTTSAAPYSHLPAPGETVRLDGGLGGASTAWGYADQFWLEQYLKTTIDAAASNEQYKDAAASLGPIAAHVTEIQNGTKASVETIQPFSYNGRLDVEARVLIEEGPKKGRELWTTCAELVDSAGHRYLRM